MIELATKKAPPTNWRETSHDSQVRLETNKNEYRRRIFDFINTRHGATCDEVEVALGIRHQTASCYIRFLTKDGLLKATPDRRYTRTGRKAIVWRVRRPEEDLQPELF